MTRWLTVLAVSLTLTVNASHAQGTISNVDGAGLIVAGVVDGLVRLRGQIVEDAAAIQKLSRDLATVCAALPTTVMRPAPCPPIVTSPPTAGKPEAGN